MGKTSSQTYRIGLKADKINGVNDRVGTVNLKRGKLTIKQYEYLKILLRRQGKQLTPARRIWLENLPQQEASRLIDTWKYK